MLVVDDAAAGMVVRFVLACGGCRDVGGIPHVSSIGISKLLVPSMEC